MEAIASPEPALARWFAHGVTSRTHPVLYFALTTFFHPLGIEAEALEAEPFSALESGSLECWLRGPRWNPARFDGGHPARRDFAPLLDHPESFLVAIDARGILHLSLNPAAGDDPAARSFLETGERGWSAVRHASQAAGSAEAFIFAATGLILASDPLAEIYIQGNDALFCKAVGKRMLAIRDPGTPT